MMAKGQKRSGREAKKPKASKTAIAPPSSAGFLRTPVRELPAKGTGKTADKS